MEQYLVTWGLVLYQAGTLHYQYNNNLRTGEGGTLHAYMVDLELHNSIFANNSASDSGGAMDITFSSANITNSDFLNSSAIEYGGAIRHHVSNIEIHDSLFAYNSAGSGGAIYSHTPHQFDVFNTNFMGNSANESGGAINTEFVEIYDCNFEDNYAALSGGALQLYEDTDSSQAIKLDDSRIYDSTIHFNVAGVDGGGIYCNKPKRFSDIFFAGGYSSANSATNGGFLHLLSCSVSILDKYDIIGNNASRGGAIFANQSSIFHDYIPDVSMINNAAEEDGGAIFAVNSQIHIFTGGKVTFSQNVASNKGGAIYIQDSNCEVITNTKESCSVDYWDSKKGAKYIFFVNNTATSGSVLYGGLLDRCYHESFHEPHMLGIDYFKQVSQYEHTHSAITSDAVKICFCLDNYIPHCSQRESETQKMRGEVIKVLVASVDQDTVPVSSVVRASYEETTAGLGEGEGRHRLNSSCTQLNYHIFTVDTSATLVIQPEGFCERSKLSRLLIRINIKNCSRGFQQSKNRCVCDHRLTQHLNISNCVLETQSVLTTRPVWLRYEGDFLKMAQYCPMDFCRITTNISLLSPNEQCANNRGGILCGACRQNYSITLGGSKCFLCTNKYTFTWLMLVFALAGAVLVALLLICNMTISHGTVNGLIFFANVVSISGLTTPQNCSIHPVLSVFIAWVNLDLGVETCFYPGMTTYQKTWLQFAFPLYIVLLVVAILVASYYSSTAMKIFGRNNIAILATPFLLSYSKALKTIISVLSVTRVLRSDADNVSAPVLPYNVWLHDGNIEYLESKHVALFAVALVFLVLVFLPYTLLLTCGQFLRSFPLRNRWLRRLTHSTAFVSVMDAYHAPYNRRHRYWTGVMLLTRCVLFIILAINHSSDKEVTSLFITTLIISIILLIKTCSTKIYRKVFINVLENSFLYNLEILSATVYYLNATNFGQEDTVCTVTNTSISISALTFLGILTYHSHLQMRKTRCYKSAKRALSRLPFRRSTNTTMHEQEQQSPTPPLQNLPTVSHVELREELLASADE